VSKKAWIIFVAICVAVLGGLVFFNRKDKVDVGSVDQGKILAASPASGNIADHVFGDTSGKTVLIEYGDFQCPACASAHPNLKEVTEEFKDKLTFIFRNNPLTTIHPNARAGAAAAEAAGLQGKYWEMHDLLYEQQNQWSSADASQRSTLFSGYAQQVGVKSLEKFRTDMAGSAVNEKIDYDLALGKTVQVSGTPTILLNGEKIESSVWSDKAKLKAAVEKALN